MPQLTNDEFDHYRVIEKSEAGDLVRNQVFRLAEIGECVEYPVGFLVRQPPLDVLQHIDHQLQLGQSFLDERRSLGRVD